AGVQGQGAGRGRPRTPAERRTRLDAPNRPGLTGIWQAGPGPPSMGPSLGAPGRSRAPMKRMLSVDDLARDARFERVRIEDVVFDPRNATMHDRRKAFTPSDPESPDAARLLMHSIFVGEVQALEGAGRTCYDFDTGSGPDEVP